MSQVSAYFEPHLWGCCNVKSNLILQTAVYKPHESENGKNVLITYNFFLELQEMEHAIQEVNVVRKVEHQVEIVLQGKAFIGFKCPSFVNDL